MLVRPAIRRRSETRVRDLEGRSLVGVRQHHPVRRGGPLRGVRIEPALPQPFANAVRVGNSRRGRWPCSHSSAPCCCTGPFALSRPLRSGSTSPRPEPADWLPSRLCGRLDSTASVVGSVGRRVAEVSWFDPVMGLVGRRGYQLGVGILRQPHFSWAGKSITLLWKRRVDARHGRGKSRQPRDPSSKYIAMKRCTSGGFG